MSHFSLHNSTDLSVRENNFSISKFAVEYEDIAPSAVYQPSLVT